MGRESTPLTPRVRLDPSDTIAAVSSAFGPGARAIVRMTGPRAWEISRSAALSPQTERRAGCWPVQLCLPDLPPVAADLLAWIAPHSYTGQDLVEFHMLSSPPLVDGLLAGLYRCGARPAQAGEFTLRAFLAGKLDLTQAEAIAEIVDAADAVQMKQALEQLAGGLSRQLHNLRRELLDLLAEVEAGLDFSEENLAFVSPQELQARIAAAGVQVDGLLEQLRRREVSGRPFQVVLAGPPNAGKSSLFNALLGVDAALVSPAAGTTRDYLARRVCWEGVEMELVDTAGWTWENTGSNDPHIAAQVDAARRARIGEADLVLVCRDLSQPVVAQTGGAELGLLPPEHLLEIQTKCDLPGPPTSLLATSARSGEGLKALRLELLQRARQSGQSAGASVRSARLSAVRCRRHLLEARRGLDAAQDGLRCRQPMELIALDLRLAAVEIGMMAGEVYTEELLDHVFGKFCVGK